MTDEEIRERWRKGGEQPPDVQAEKAVTSVPIGVSSRQIFVIALLAVLGWQAISAWVLMHSPDASDRAAILQSAINIATLAFGFYLGSSASSRNKEHR